MSEIADTQGLVCGYSVDSSGRMTNIDMIHVDDVLAADDALVWLHLDQADARARAWINACDRIPAAAKAMLLGSDSHMRIEAAGAGLSGVVGDLHHEFAQRPDRLDVLRLYLDNRCLISARQEPLAAIDKLREAISSGLQVEWPIALVTQFLYHVTDTLGDLILGLSSSSHFDFLCCFEGICLI
jgi:zinc transporter